MQRKQAKGLKMQQVTKDKEVQGYLGLESEEREGSKPVETMRMKGPGGRLSVGINRNQEITMSLTSDTPGNLLREDRSSLRMSSAKRVRENPDKVYTNSHDEKVSAVVYKDDFAKSPKNLIKSLKSAMEGKENIVADTVMPFLSTEKEKETKRELEQYLRSCLEEGKTEGYRWAKEEYGQLAERIAWKEREEQGLVHNLEAQAGKMKEEAKRLAIEFSRKSTLWQQEPLWEDGDDGEGDNGKGDGKGNGKERDGEKTSSKGEAGEEKDIKGEDIKGKEEDEKEGKGDEGAD